MNPDKDNTELCDVVDNSGINCPNKPEHRIRLDSGYWVALCNPCYESYIKGAWQKMDENFNKNFKSGKWINSGRTM